MTDLIEPAYHEFDAHFNFSYNPDGNEDPRLRPFWAFEYKIRDVGGATETTVEIDGDTFEITLYYQESGIATTNHTSEDVDTVREFRIKWERAVDPAGQCTGSFHIRPRTPDLETDDGTPISTPQNFTGVNVHAQGSNLPFDQYLPLWRAICRSLGISRRYWRDEWLHESSNIQDVERYVRIEREHSGEFVAVDGPIARAADLLAADREGYRKHVADDTEIEGYYHTATVGADRARELVRLHTFPKEIKHYYGKHPNHTSDDHPTHYPKVGVSYQTSIHDDTLYWDQLNRLERELDETLLNVLRWAGLPVTAEDLDVRRDHDDDDNQRTYGQLDDAPGPYVEDSYWRVETSHRQRRLVENPLPEIEADQESVVIRALRHGLEDSDRDLLETLVTDGGQVAPAEVADEHGWHLETVYTALDRLEEIVEHEYAEIRLRSHHVARRVVEAVDRADRVGEHALEVSAKALAGADRFERASDAMTEWLDQHGVEIDDRDDGRMELRAGSWESLSALQEELREFRSRWTRAGFDRTRLQEAAIQFSADGYSQAGIVHGIID